jgi:hypothetical protein
LELELEEGSFPCVVGEVNGVAAIIGLDSGANLMIIDTAFAKELGLKPARQEVAAGVGPELVTTPIVEGVEIRLGGLSLEPAEAGAFDLKKVHIEAQVVLGTSFFHEHQVTVDYPGRELVVHPRTWPEPRDAVLTLPVWSSGHGQMFVEAQFEDLPSAWFAVDTGSKGTVDVSRFYVAANRLIEGHPAGFLMKNGGVGGKFETWATTARSFTLGGHAFEEVPVYLGTKDDRGLLALPDVAGIIGSKIWQRFSVTFDLQRNQLLLKPGAGADAPFHSQQLKPVFQYEDGKLNIKFVPR